MASGSSPGDSQREQEWERLFAQAAPDENGPVPPNVVATPSQLAPGEHITWWRPGWHDTWRYVGWRWVLLTPSLLLLIFLFLPLRLYYVNLYVIAGKLALLMAAVALTLMGFVFRRAARARQEPFCIFCGYNLTGLPDNYRCPECGRPYTWRLIAEYRRDPQWFIERYRAMSRLPPRDEPFPAGPVRRRRSRDGT
jgi:hypothetical protein